MIYYCVVVGIPVCTVQYCSVLETNVLGYIGTVQKAHPWYVLRWIQSLCRY